MATKKKNVSKKKVVINKKNAYRFSKEQVEANEAKEDKNK